MINGWKIASSSSSKEEVDGHHLSSSLSTTTTWPSLKGTKEQIPGDVIFGRIKKDIPTGRWSREFEIHANENHDDDHQSSTKIVMDAEKYPSLKPWMSIRNARKLLVPGVSIGVHIARHEDGNDGTANTTKDNTHEATHIQIVAVLPATPYLARLLTFSKENLSILFTNSNHDNNAHSTNKHPPPPAGGGDDDDDSFKTATSSPSTSFIVPLACALRPCSVVQLQHLLVMAQQQSENERTKQNLFKHAQLLKLCDDIRHHQGWSRGPQKKPLTPHHVWLALLRMEQQWLRQEETTTTDSMEDDKNDNVNTNKKNVPPPTKSRRIEKSLSPQLPLPKQKQQQTLSYGGINVDPSLNVPDPTDPKRMSYIYQRKRPQVVWMVNLISRLVQEEEDTPCASQADDNVLHLIDIGGGRGDLAIAVAAYFAQEQRPKEYQRRRKVHVTVLDVNESSLQAGQQRAQDAMLDSCMSFKLCDITDRSKVLNILDRGETENYMVYGLHCCGGLSEAAVDLALGLGAKYFCVSTCCFRSNPHLACLSNLADTMVCSPVTPTCDIKQKNDTSSSSVSGTTRHKEEKNSSTSSTPQPQPQPRQQQQHVHDRDLVSSLAVLVLGQGQHRGIHVLNDMRLAAAQYKCKLGKKYTLKCWQETFPLQYSVQNRVMVGVLKEAI